MNSRIIPIHDTRSAMALPLHSVQAGTSPLPAVLLDQRARPLRDLRISVTDRCNFRCNYCMPKEVFNKDYAYLPHSSLLSFEEIEQMARVFVGQGVRKIRLTGGEPLLRKNIEKLVSLLSQLRTPEGERVDLTLTTNGSLLQKKALALKAAGLHRVTVSLDALDDTVFRTMNDVDFPVQSVLDGIAAAQEVGFESIKVNMVVKKGVNDHEIVSMARHFKNTGITLRYIEFMDVGLTNGWRMDDVVPSDEVLSRLKASFPLMALPATSKGETAQRWGYADESGQHDAKAGEIGLISSVTHAFCGQCNRARLSTEGKLYLCLFAGQGYDLKSLVRSESLATEKEARLAQALASIWQGRHDNYSEQRALGQAMSTTSKRIEMSYIGG
jgi:cyclic pyranopterin phosphate synthase